LGSFARNGTPDTLGIAVNPLLDDLEAEDPKWFDSTHSVPTKINERGERQMVTPRKVLVGRISLAFVLVSLIVVPEFALAQAASPFMTGATALQTNILAWLTPIAVILVMVLGAMAMANRISWGWCIAAILGIAVSFGATQIVTWVRGLFAV
jgi:type IV secretion system protein VirB2